MRPLTLIPAAVMFLQTTATATVFEDVLPRDMDHLNKQYESCLRDVKPVEKRNCRVTIYKPLIEKCMGRKNACLLPFSSERPGAMLATRCPGETSCKMVDKNGIYSRLTIRNGEERAELRDPLQLNDNEEITYNFRMRIPLESTLAPVGSVVVAQFHATNDDRPPMALRYKADGRMAITFCGKRKPMQSTQCSEHFIEKGLFKKGEWHDISIAVRPGAKGSLRVTSGHQEWGAWNNVPIGYDEKQYYFKIGPYEYQKRQQNPFRVDYADFSRGPRPVGPAEYQSAEVQTAN